MIYANINYDENVNEVTDDEIVNYDEYTIDDSLDLIEPF